MLWTIQRRTYEVLFMTRDRDAIATAVFLFIFALILVNVAIGVLETDTDFRESVNRALGFGAEEDRHAYEVAHGHGGGSHSIGFFWWFEFISVVIFSIEYLLRLWSCGAGAEYPGLIRGRIKLATEPLLIVDLVAIAPFYIGLIAPTADLRFIRALRLFRIFRIFRSGKLASSFVILANVLKSKREELAISTVVVLIMVVLSASVMYLAEHDNKPMIGDDGLPVLVTSRIPVGTHGHEPDDHDDHIDAGPVRETMHVNLHKVAEEQAPGADLREWRLGHLELAFDVSNKESNPADVVVLVAMRNPSIFGGEETVLVDQRVPTGNGPVTLSLGSVDASWARASTDTRFDIRVEPVAGEADVPIEAVLQVSTGKFHGDPDHFPSVPASMWWAVITITTIGYGDTFPVTTGGKIIGAFIGFLGICVFALPVGIIGAGFVEETAKRQKAREEAEEEGTHVSLGEEGHKAPHSATTGSCPHCGKPIITGEPPPSSSSGI